MIPQDTPDYREPVSEKMWEFIFPFSLSWSTVRKQDPAGFARAFWFSGRSGVRFYDYEKMRAVFVDFGSHYDSLLPRSASDFKKLLSETLHATKCPVCGAVPRDPAPFGIDDHSTGWHHSPE